MPTIHRTKRDTPFVQIDKPAYYGILPACVRYDNECTPMARIMYSEITALSNKNGYCNAGNDYFAKLYDVSTETVSRWISKLCKRGHVSIDADPVTGHNRKLYPLNKNVIPHDKKIKAPCQKDQGPLDKKIKHNNTSIILQDNTKGKSENLLKDVFVKIDGLKKKIGPKHYSILNEACQDDKGSNYEKAKGMFSDGRFNSLIDWLEYKKEIRRGLKIKGAITELINLFWDHTPKEMKIAVSTAKANGYTGLFPKKLSENKVRENIKANVRTLTNGKRRAL